jgi:hypothetical protein
VFLYIGGTSVIAGLVAVLGAHSVGAGLAAAVLGVAFAVTFFVAMMLRPGAGVDPVRATLGVISIVFLVGCFVAAVSVGDSGTVSANTELIRGAVAAGLFTFGMAGVGVLIPSAVGAGLAMAGLVATAVLVAAASGVEAFGLAVAALVAGVVGLELGFRVTRLRAHPSAGTWMVNVAGLLSGLAVTALALSFQGTAVAAAALMGVALVLVAWRWHAVVAAVVAVWPLSTAEGYLIVNAVGGDSTVQGVALLLVGLVVLLLVGAVGMRMRGRVAEGRHRPVVIEELLLVAAVVMALISLAGSGNFNAFPKVFPGSGGSVTQPTFQPFPTLPSG